MGNDLGVRILDGRELVAQRLVDLVQLAGRLGVEVPAAGGAGDGLERLFVHAVDPAPADDAAAAALAYPYRVHRDAGRLRVRGRCLRIHA